MLRREPRASNNDDLIVETELSILLKRGESIRECAGCGEKFVSRRAGERLLLADSLPVPGAQRPYQIAGINASVVRM